ncbi:MAG: amino acid ABC transporter permease [Pseudomonadota bacterium]
MAHLDEQRSYPPGQHPDLPPPRGTTGVWGWVRKSLFSNWINTILTLVTAYLLYIVITGLFSWSVTAAVVSGDDRRLCDLGRTSAALSEVIDRVQWQNLGSSDADVARTANRSLNAAASALGDVTDRMAAASDILPPAFVAAAQQVDPAALQQEVRAAIQAQDYERARTLLNETGPLIAWGQEHDGACWVVIKERINQFIFGFYPDEEQWRPIVFFLLLIIAMAPILVPEVPYRKQLAWFTVAFPFLSAVLLYGMPSLGLEAVPTSLWGGFLLTTIIGVTGIVGSLPIGIVLALGRRSTMPIVRMLSIAFIEAIRGVPLITILFVASTMLPLFVPQELNPDKVIRALIMVTLFASAYMAEVIRGGLQAIPKGQYEAAAAMGHGYWQTTRLVIMPQALRITVPGIVNTFIGLFKDTSLVSIIGLFDLLLSVRTAVRDGAWIGFANEVYAFAAVVYFVICFGMSRYSMYLERKLNVGTRRS